jgi:hypothetical protein
MKKSRIIALLFISFITAFSCTDCGPFPDKSRVKDILLNTYKINNQNNNIILNIIDNQSIIYNELAFEITPEIETFFSLKKRFNSLNLVQTAYACDPITPEMVDTITNIELYSNSNYNTTHPANTNLADIIKVKLPQSISNDYSLINYLELNPKFPSSMLLLFNEPPLSNTSHRFTIKIYTNGETLNYKEHTFEPIEVLAQ